MTISNKTITPFCVDMTDATEDEIRSLHQMMLDAGVEEDESVDEFIHYQKYYPYMGCIETGTFHYDVVDIDFDFNLITLDQVPSHLGLDIKGDDSLVEGTLEHAYMELNGDLDNTLNASFVLDNEYVTFCLGNRHLEKGYYIRCDEALVTPDHNWKKVCTVGQFKEYASNQQKLREISCVKPLNDESPYECTKPLKWTLTASQEGVKLQCGMLVKVVVNSTNFEGEGIVEYIGKENVVVNIDDVEDYVHIDCIHPISEKTLEEVQREKVVDVLKDTLNLDPYVYDKDFCTNVYDKLLGLGVFKESK